MCYDIHIYKEVRLRTFTRSPIYNVTFASPTTAAVFASFVRRSDSVRSFVRQQPVEKGRKVFSIRRF